MSPRLGLCHPNWLLTIFPGTEPWECGYFLSGLPYTLLTCVCGGDGDMPPGLAPDLSHLCLPRVGAQRYSLED